jgi:hypothetical protein
MSTGRQIMVGTCPLHALLLRVGPHGTCSGASGSSVARIHGYLRTVALYYSTSNFQTFMVQGYFQPINL